MDAIEFLESYSKKSSKFLKSFFASKKKIGRKIDKTVVQGLQKFEDYSSGGKKLRGALTVLGYQTAGGKDFNKILPVSCGIEILHNFLLIHDDIIDRDKVRRGKPTIHRQFSKKRGEHYGLSKAIIIGDIGVFLGYELIVGSNFPRVRITKALSKLNENLLETGYGQVLDIESDYKRQVTWNEMLKTRTYKTAYYTFVMPLSVGAILGGAEIKTVNSIEKFGIPVGIAFQIADDILGVFGDRRKTGKSNENDIREGKKTFLYAKALELTKREERKFLIKWYGSDNLDAKKIGKIRRIMKDSGSLDHSRKLAGQMAEKGKEQIENITKKPQFQETLSSLADFIVERSR